MPEVTREDARDTVTYRALEMVSCMLAGETFTSRTVAELLGMSDVSPISAVLLNHDGRGMLRAIGKLHRVGTAGRSIVVYEVVDPDCAVRVHPTRQRGRIPGRSHDSYRIRELKFIGSAAVG